MPQSFDSSTLQVANIQNVYKKNNPRVKLTKNVTAILHCYDYQRWCTVQYYTADSL